MAFHYTDHPTKSIQCKRQLHPFQDASYLDVAPVFTSLARRGITSAHSPDFTSTFLTLAESLAADARASLREPGNAERASALFLRACALLRVARFPYSPSSHGDAKDVCEPKRKAYDLQKTYYLEAAGLSGLNSPLDEVLVPHVHDAETHPEPGHRGDLGMRGREAEKIKRRPHMPVFVRVPLDTLLTGRQCPAAVVLTKDRTGNSKTCEDVLSRGWACVVVEVPGEGDCPVTKEQGREAEELLWRSLLDWMGNMFFFDTERVVVMGEGDVATRVASTHGARVKGVVAYTDEQPEDGRIFDQRPLCRTLVVRGGVKAIPSNGLWTPPLEKKDESLTLSTYEAGSTACIGQLKTTDMGKVYDWVDAVVESRASEIDEGPINLPASDSNGKQAPLPPWNSMDLTPPNSDIEMSSSPGSCMS